MTRPVTIWWERRSARERRLLAIAAGVVACAIVATVADAVRRDLGGLRARVDRAERRLTAARLLAGRLEAAVQARPAADEPPLLSRVERAIGSAVGSDRLVRLEPNDGTDAGTEARIVDLDLADVVRALGALESASNGLLVRDVEVRARPDAPTRYDATLVVVPGGAS